MAYSATLAHMRGSLGEQDYKRILGIFSRAGLSMDHPQFDEDILDRATKAILRTRDGKLRAAIPSPLGSCIFLNDVDMDEMYRALRKHKELMKEYPRQGAGIEAFVDSSDTGYTMNDKPVEANGKAPAETESILKDDAKASGAVNGDLHQYSTNGISQSKDAMHQASGPEGVDGSQKGVTNGVNGHVNGHTNGA